MSLADPARPRYLLWSEVAVAAVLGITAFALTGMVIVWVVAGIAAGWLVCRGLRWSGRRAEPSSRVRTLGQVLVGSALGPALATQDFARDAAYLPAILGAMLAILAGSVLTAYANARWARVDGLTAGLATLPGGLAIMPSVAGELGRPAGLVALIQSVRMTVVICAVPLLAPLMGDVAAEPVTSLAQGPEGPPGWAFWIALLVIAVAAARLARRWRIPVPALLGPMFAAIAFTLLLRGLGADPSVLRVPLAQEVVGQVFLGLTVGEYLAQRARFTPRHVLGGVGGVLTTFVLALVIAVVLARVTPWSFMTCLLVVAPGGAPEMVVVAAAVDADLHVVVLAQTGRQIIVNALMPLWLWLFTKFDPDDHGR